MRILSLIIGYAVLYLVGAYTPTDSPHGKDFKISCTTCHSSKGWALDKEIYSFDHASTKMPLTGQHKDINCRLCHASLVFSEAKAKTECVQCHEDVHSNTVGNFCDKCHTSQSWLVNNITEIHQQSRFPLVGVHTIAECTQCHKSESLLRYDVQGVECIDCHRENYLATSNPPHTDIFSTDCSQCHNIYSYEWGGSGFNHNMFPLTLGHSNLQCSQCHTNNNFTSLSTDCYSCHKADYEATTHPAHNSGCYSTDCKICHTTNPGWQPVSFQHEAYFPINSGNHGGLTCNQCHTNPANCTYDCLGCHNNQSSITNEHNDVGGFTYSSTACFNCHPRGVGGD